MSQLEKQEPQPVEVKGIELRCPVCRNNRFRTRQVLLNTTAATLLNLDWADRNATCFICSECTHILWFHGK